MSHRDDAFSAFVASRSASLRRTAYLLTGDGAAADDLLQESLLRVYLAWGRIRDVGAVEDYARTVMARQHVSSWRRRRWRETSVASVPETGHPDARDQFGGPSSVDERDEVWRALAALGARQRATVVLRYYEDLTEQEIARVLNCSVGTVKSQLARGLTRLSAVLTPEATGPAAKVKEPR